MFRKFLYLEKLDFQNFGDYIQKVKQCYQDFWIPGAKYLAPQTG